MSDNKLENPEFFPNDTIQFSFGDLYQVKSDLDGYELRNISRIVNVLGGQYTEIVKEHEEITEEDSYSEFENETNSEQSLTTSTSEAMESSANSHQDKETAFSISGQVKASYGTIKAQVDTSNDNKNGSGSSKSNAQSYAKSVVESSRKSVRTRVLNTKRKNTQIRDLETQKMGLDNRGGGNFVGVYRNVSEVHKAQLIKHQKHLFAKIYIPTPSENYSKHISGALSAASTSPVGLKYTREPNKDKVDFSFTSITENNWLDENWLTLAAEFGLSEPIPFPNDLIEIKSHLVSFTDNQGPRQQLFTQKIQFSVPDGYIPDETNIGNVNRLDGQTVYLEFALPNKDALGVQKNKTENFKFDFDNQTLKNIEMSGNSFEIAFIVGFTLATAISCEVKYVPSQKTLNLWRLNFYNQILEASDGEPTTEDKLGLSRNVNVLSNVDAAKKLIKEELERESIQFVLGTDLRGFDGHWRGVDYEDADYPEVNVNKTNSLQPIVSFLSGAFDFEKMSYRFLPAYLGAESNRLKMFDSKNTGEIRDFLQASWAEVILPIRRGEEYKLFYMLETGLIWGSSDEEAPLPNKRQYLALAEEIEEDRALTQAVAQGTTETSEEIQAPSEEVVDEWTFNLPTAFEILQQGSDINGIPEATESASGLTSKPE